MTGDRCFIHSSFWGGVVGSCVGLLSVLAGFFFSGLLSGAVSALSHGRSGCYGEQWRETVVEGRKADVGIGLGRVEANRTDEGRTRVKP